MCMIPQALNSDVAGTRQILFISLCQTIEPLCGQLSLISLHARSRASALLFLSLSICVSSPLLSFSLISHFQTLPLSLSLFALSRWTGVCSLEFVRLHQVRYQPWSYVYNLYGQLCKQSLGCLQYIVGFISCPVIASGHMHVSERCIRSRIHDQELDRKPAASALNRSTKKTAEGDTQRYVPEAKNP